MNTATSPATAAATLNEQSIRERAYLRWLDQGSPQGDDHAHWFWAQQQLRTELEKSATTSHALRLATDRGVVPPSSHHSPLVSHGARPAHDRRVDVVTGEAPQRVRSRQSDHLPRPQPN